MSFIKKFLVSLKVFSALPVQINNFNTEDYRRLAPYLTIVGFIIGIQLFLLAIIFGYIAIMSKFSAVLVVSILLLAFWYSVTDITQIDGLSKLFNESLGKKNRNDVISLPATSVYNSGGILAIIFVILIKLACILYIFNYFSVNENFELLLLLIILPMISRFSCVVAISTYPYIGKSQEGKVLQASSIYPNDIIASFIPIIIIITVISIMVNNDNVLFLTLFISSLLTLLVGFAVPYFINRSFQGHNMETYGANIEIVEVAHLLFTILCLTCLS